VINGMRNVVRALIVPAALAACGAIAAAQPIFTTAPSHIQGVVVGNGGASGGALRSRAGVATTRAAAKSSAQTGSRSAAGKSAIKQQQTPSVRTASGRDKVVPAATSEGVVRHLTNSIQGFRFTGEISALEWPVYFTAAQSKVDLKFKVGYLSAVSVMPEASRLKLVINDHWYSQHSSDAWHAYD